MTTLQIVIAVLACVCVVQRIAWRKEAAMLKAGRDDWQRKAEDYAAAWREVEAVEARFRKVLGYYGDEETWSAPGRAHSPAFKDRGKLAREVLSTPIHLPLPSELQAIRAQGVANMARPGLLSQIGAKAGVE